MSPVLPLKPRSSAGGRFDALEAMRGFAAIYVVAGHICNDYFHNPSWALPFRFAAEAVVLFFLLSGFVVRLSTPDDSGWADFFVKRIKRIYPLFVVSLVFSYLMASVAQKAWAPFLSWSLLGNLLMLQDFGYARPGVWVDQYYNVALWSLAYEWWFYVLFIVLLKWGRSVWWRNLSVVCLTVLAALAHRLAPSPFGYFAINFAIWWAAAEVARQYMATGQIAVRSAALWSLFLLVVAASWWPYLQAIPAQERSPGLYPILDMRRFLAGAVLLMVAILWHRLWHVGGSRLFQNTFAWFRRFAPISYGIYIFHFPIIDFFVNTRLAAHPALCVPVILATILAVGYLAEKRLQPWINQWPIWGRWRSQSPAKPASPSASSADPGWRPELQ